MSDEADETRPTNFVEGSTRPARRGRSAGGRGRRIPGLSNALEKLPVPLPVATAVCAVLAVLLVAAIVVRIVGSGTASADKVADAPATTAVPATAPPATTVPPAPLVTRPPAEENAARRAAFLETMKTLGLNPKQAECAANRVEMTIGWSQLSESLMDPGKPGQLEDLMVGCVKG